MAIIGSNSGETLNGTITDDDMQGRDGNDTLYGGQGNDTLYGGSGFTDHLWGGKDNDTYIIRDNLDVVHELANEGVDTVIATLSYTLTANVENLNLLAGSTGRGNSLHNVITGNAGNNTLDGGLGNDTLYGGQGIDTAEFSDWDTTTPGFSTKGTTVVFDVTAEIGHATRTEYNPVTNSYVVTEEDTLGGIENIRGTNFNDIFNGNSDFVVGAVTDNEFFGRGGNDTFKGDTGRDTYHGDSGIDTVDYGASSIGVTINLGSGASGIGGLAEGDLFTSVENAVGTRGNDNITGSDADNRLSGGNGDDTIVGGIGNDTLIGGAETDIEHLTGGAGYDTFVYLNRSDSNTTATRTGDYITDFNANEDLVDLRALNVTASNLSITNNVSGGAHYARILEDLNHNGQADANELSINIIVEGTTNVTLQDILI